MSHFAFLTEKDYYLFPQGYSRLNAFQGVLLSFFVTYHEQPSGSLSCHAIQCDWLFFDVRVVYLASSASWF